MMVFQPYTMFCVPSIHPETTWDPGALGVLLVVCSSTDRGWGQHTIVGHHYVILVILEVCERGPGDLAVLQPKTVVLLCETWDWCFQYYTKSTIKHHTPAWEVPPTIHHGTSWWWSRFQPADTVFIRVPPIHRGPGCVGGDTSSQHHSNSNPIDGDHEPSWSWDPLSSFHDHQTYKIMRCWV